MACTGVIQKASVHTGYNDGVAVWAGYVALVEGLHAGDVVKWESKSASFP